MKMSYITSGDSGGCFETQNTLRKHFESIRRNIKRFYENQNQYRSAIIYYQKVMKFPGSKHLAEARQRHADLLIRIAPLKTASPQVKAGEARQPVPVKLKDFAHGLVDLLKILHHQK